MTSLPSRYLERNEASYILYPEERTQIKQNLFSDIKDLYLPRKIIKI